MDILYVGNDSYHKILQKAAYKHNAVIDTIPSEDFNDVNKINTYISGYIGDNENIIVINYDCFNNNDVHKILNEVLDLKNVSVCLLHKGYTTKDKQIEKAIRAGVKFLLLSVNDKENIRMFSRIIEGKDKENISYIQQREKSKTKKINKNPSQMDILSDVTPGGDNIKPETTPVISKKSDIGDNEAKQEYTNTIVVAGCMPRIGTTTLSIHILSYLVSKGKKVCYVDKSGNNYIYWLSKLYGNMGIVDNEHNKYTLNNIDFYFMINKNVLDYIYDSDYDYILYEFGVVETEDINSSIVTKGIKKIKMLQEADYAFLCCGAKCNEFFTTNAIITGNDCKNMYLMFYSVSKEDREDMKSFCQHYCKQVYFVPYIDNEFFVQKNTNDLLEQIFDLS